MIKKQITFDISSKTIVKIVLVLLALGFLYLVRDIIAILFATFVLSAALTPAVDWLHKKRIPRALSVLLIYLVLIGIVTLSVYLLIPPLVAQIKELANQFPTLYDKFVPYLLKIEGLSEKEPVVSNVQKTLADLGDNIAAATRSIFSTLGNILGSIFSAIVILVLSFYLIVQKNALKNFIKAVVPSKRAPYIVNLFDRINNKIGRWLSGQIILCIAVGVLIFIGLWLLGVKYALVLAIFAGITEIIPYIGPVIGGLPAVLLVFIESPLLALFVIILYFVVQQLENHILVPKIMQKAIGLNPIVVIFALLIGGKLAGILGMILAVPVVAGISVFVRDYIGTKENLKK